VTLPRRLRPGHRLAGFAAPAGGVCEALHTTVPAARTIATSRQAAPGARPEGRKERVPANRAPPARRRPGHPIDRDSRRDRNESLGTGQFLPTRAHRCARLPATLPRSTAQIECRASSPRVQQLTPGPRNAGPPPTDRAAATCTRPGDLTTSAHSSSDFFRNPIRKISEEPHRHRAIAVLTNVDAAVPDAFPARPATHIRSQDERLKGVRP